MMGSKTGWTATGCTGTATWKIGDTGKMLVVMWSIPFDQNWYKILSNHFESKNVNETFVLMWWIPFDLKLVIPTPRMVFFLSMQATIIPFPTPHMTFDDLMKGTPTGVPLGSCLCKRTLATCGIRCIMGRSLTSLGKNSMIATPGIGINDLLVWNGNHSHVLAHLLKFIKHYNQDRWP